MNNTNKNDNFSEYEDQDEELDELGIELPEINSEEKEKIILALEDTFLVRLDSISQFGENALDLNEIDKFVKRFPKHKDKIDKILAKAKEKKSKNDLGGLK